MDTSDLSPLEAKLAPAQCRMEQLIHEVRPAEMSTLARAAE